MSDEDVIQLMARLPAPELPNDDEIFPIFSLIQGMGLASKYHTAGGNIVLTMLCQGVRQIGARYINHSDTPNAKAEIIKDDLVAVALRNIESMEGITMCYAHNMIISATYVKMMGTL